MIWGDGTESFTTLTQREVRVLSPFVFCKKTKKWLFLKKAILLTVSQNWEVLFEYWLSREEFMFMKLRGDFDEC